MRRRGTSLVNTLMVSTLLAGLAFTTATLTISHLSLNTRLENSKIARDLAESAASDCLGQLMANPDWQGDVNVELESAPGGWGRTTFSKARAGSWSISASTNNLTGVTARRSQADPLKNLPPTSVEVFSYGYYRGATARVCQVIAIPPYRYAMASTGNIHSSGGLTVASVDDPAILARGFDSVIDEDLHAGHLAGNRVGPQSVHLESTQSQPVLIKGGVDSAGSVSLVGGARVMGSVHENGQPVPLPDIRVSDYDPQERADVVKCEETVQQNFRIEKPTRQKGNLKVTDGLTMASGYLYVDGDLDIYGGVRGKGAIFATGNVKIHGVSTYGADNQQAIVAKGDIRIEGSNRNESIFQGVIYTEGNFTAKDVTLVGSLVGNKLKNPDGSGGTSMELQACNVIYNQKLLQTNWSSGFDITGNSYTEGNLFSPNSLTFDSAGTGRPLTEVEDPKAKNFYDPEIDQFRWERGQDVPFTRVLVPTIDGGYHEFATWDEAIEVLSTPHHGLPIRFKRPQSLFTSIPTFGISIPNPFGPPAPPAPAPPSPPAAYLPTWDPEVVALLKAARKSGGGVNGFTRGVDHARMQVEIFLFNDYYLKTKARWMRLGEFGFTMSPNKFIQMSDKTRRMLWWDE